MDDDAIRREINKVAITQIIYVQIFMICQAPMMTVEPNICDGPYL